MASRNYIFSSRVLFVWAANHAAFAQGFASSSLVVFVMAIGSLIDLANGTRTENEILSPEEEASVNVDALVSDAVDEHQGRSTPLLSHILNQPRRATPTIPPGFTAPVLPRNIALNQPSRPPSRNAAPGVPVVPVMPATPGQAATPIGKRTKKEPEGITPGAVKTIAGVTSTPASVPATPAKASQKASPSKAKAYTIETPKKPVEEPVNTAQKESSPASVSPTKAIPKSKTSGKKAPTVSEVTPQRDIKVLASTSISSSKRQPPGKLNISAATKPPENEAPSAASSTKQEVPAKPIRTVSATAPTSVPASPAAASTGSPIKKPIGAKTLRVVATPRTESPPQMPPHPSLPQVPTVEKLRSRQASIASINQPGTPASDLISDTASFTSTSISRASSPPLVGGKVGSAPIRKKTKSQAKKDRQERARQAEEERAMEEQTPELEVVQAPIVGRKKKARKPATNPKTPAASTKSQPEPTKTSSKEDEELEELYQANMAAKKAAADAADAAAAAAAAAAATAAAAAAIKPSAPSPRAEPVTEPEPDTAKDKRELTAQSILTDLQRTGKLVASALEFFKPLSSSLAHASKATPTSGGPVGPPDLKIHFTEADLEALTKKQPVHLHGHDGTSDSRTLITPQGKFFWGLTQELEEKALELEKYIEELKGAARFHPKKHTAHNTGFQGQPNLPALATALKEAGAKLSKSTRQDMPRLDSPSAYQGGPSQRSQLPPVQANEDLLPPNQVQQPQTPADAGVYLNQFVLPNTDNPSPNAPRPEMAAVGGLPGAGTANISVNANKLAKAAKAVAEGGAVGPELEGIGAITADLLGGVFVQNLEALVGADLGFSSFSGTTDIGIDGSGLNVQGLVSAFEAGVGAGAGAFGGGRGRGGRSVLSVEEAEQAMLAAKKDHEALEKKLSALIKRNKKMMSAGKV
ncbi:hypothetical protein P171DRAFT_517119 [Karstenula rhodostoma CBS 690.94]|uniref:Uncharacterized protein n=1 Tax=Karstenula rhodostoma CBS 690.94 TaxID=1392251 RepID=A0A9P4UHB3_9PLEO|nr:hypothetical protein P171DRAFT_517119 [Karstenula rhodostoma CBS 690.94]